MKKITLVICLLILPLFLMAGEKGATPKAKYVFYFIGDGMGLTHVCAAEGYQSYLDGNRGKLSLAFSKFPVLGMATTYSASNLITCSSAAGTALSTGFKTNNGYLCVAPDSTRLKSIAYMIHDAGFKVGISSTVYLNHATPAAFYAHSISRESYYDIAMELPETGFEFFAGGGYNKPQGRKGKSPSAYDAAEKAGYVIASGMDEYKSKKDASKKMILLQDSGRESLDFPYAIDQEPGDMNQADLVSATIDYLYGKQGFFMMSEGGKIDWASHANQTKTTIMETIDFSRAIDVALQFYNEHPDETLIIVTADHETGGLTMCNTRGYEIHYEMLDPVKHSSDYYLKTKDSVMYVADQGLTPLSKLGWSSADHSGVAVPVFAIGAGSSLFSGFMDNTDIPKKICEAMGVKFE